jgi:hypothetical protein
MRSENDMTTQSPTTRCHRLTLTAAFVVILAGPAVRPAAAQTPGMTRVRSSHPSIAALIIEGRERSTTFRRLVDTIDATDGIVYIEEGTCFHSVRACLMMTVTVAGSNRILRVLVNTRTAEWDLIGSIGHEMRHAVEVLSDPHVKDNSAIYFFYQRQSSSGRAAFETDAAVQAGLDVRAEVRRHQSTERGH